MLPKGSMWRIGFRLIRPRSFAVESPNFSAIHACADSWNEMANRMTASLVAKSAMLKLAGTRRDYSARRRLRAAQVVGGRWWVVVRARAATSYDLPPITFTPA